LDRTGFALADLGADTLRLGSGRGWDSSTVWMNLRMRSWIPETTSSIHGLANRRRTVTAWKRTDMPVSGIT
jgi:hypothetical protein